MAVGYFPADADVKPDVSDGRVRHELSEEAEVGHVQIPHLAPAKPEVKRGKISSGQNAILLLNCKRYGRIDG